MDAPAPLPPLPDGAWRPALTAGGAITAAARVWSQHLVTLIVTGTIVYLPALLVRQPETSRVGMFAIWSLQGPASLVGPLSYCVLSALVPPMVLKASRGSSISFADLLIGLPRLLPTIGTLVVTTLLTYVGFALLLVPGMMLMSSWYLVGPIAIFEPHTANPRARSAALVEGLEWTIFGLWMAMYALEVVAGVAFYYAALGPSWPMRLVRIAVMSGGLGTFAITVRTLVYEQLRVARDGSDTAQLAKVFE